MRLNSESKNYKLKHVPTKERLVKANFRKGGRWINF